jgi:hypothetical protein
LGLLIPGASTSITLVAIGSKAARKCAALFSTRMRRSVGSMPKARK